MKKIAQRTTACLLLLLFMAGGFGFHFAGLVKNGGEWASFPVNRHAFSNANLSVGSIIDRNGEVLAAVDNGQRIFSENELTRRATLHVTGDEQGNIGTGALSYYARELMGYSIVNGVYSLFDSGNIVQLTIDSTLNKIAFEALGSNKGAVVFYNYRTGEVLCMTSAPSFDPYYPLNEQQLNTGAYEGAYINRCVSSSYTPGSVFKVITLAAAIENIPELFDMKFYCPGYIDIDGERIHCSGIHNNCDIYEAFAFSCNVAFAELAQILKSKTLEKYARNFGLTESFKMSGMPVAGGGFSAAPDGSSNLSWSGIGQYDDLVNPLAMARVMAAVANGGVAVNPRIVKGVTAELGYPTALGFSLRTSERLMKKTTADILSEMLRYNAENVYAGYYGLSEIKGLSAKTGTAELRSGEPPHAWFTGFINDARYPVAFSVIVESSGWGLQYAVPVAQAVLNEIIK